MSETRSGQRFPLQLPIKIDGRKRSFTHDMSAAGVFISGESSLAVGSRLKFQLTLPKALLGVKRDVTVKCEGRVVRVDKGAKARRGRPTSLGIACIIDDYKFVRAE